MSFNRKEASAFSSERITSLPKFGSAIDAAAKALISILIGYAEGYGKDADII